MGNLEARVRQLDRLQAIGDLTGGIAHHFNNILTGALGYAELARAAMPPGPARDDLDASLAISERAVALTRQLLAFGRREMLVQETIDVSAVIDALSPAIAAQLPPGIRLEVRLADERCVIRFERRRLERILLNLAAHAVDAMPDGGRISIMTTVADRDGGPLPDGTALVAGRYVRIEVSDTGSGMDDETRARAFEPFFTTEGPGRETGMGLPTVYGMVGQAGGQVELTSAAGAGTTVRLDLPVAAPSG